MPPCTVYVVRDVGPVCGYAELDDWKLVLGADSELFIGRQQLKLEHDRNSHLTLEIKSLEGQVAEYDHTQLMLMAQLNKVTNELVALDRKYQHARVGNGWSGSISWTLAGVSLSVLAGFILASQL